MAVIRVIVPMMIGAKIRNFIKRYGKDRLLDCLEENEKSGIVYHREGLNGDYDDFDDVEKLIEFIKTGER